MSLRTKFAMILCAVFFVKLGLIASFRTYLHPVPWEYESLVNSVLAGKGYVYNFLGTDYRSYNTPLFGFLCLGVYLLTNHSYFAVLAIQSLFTLFLALTVFSIAKIILDERIGFIAGIAVSLHPGFMYYDAFNLTPLSIDSFFIAIAALFFLKYMTRPTFARAAIVGCAIGIGTLSRGILGALLPFLALYGICFAEGATFRRKIKLSIVMVAMTFMIIVPWVVRNYVIHREFVFISSTTGENLWRGNNKNALGTSLTAEGKSILGLWPDDFRQKIYALSEMEQKKFFENEAISFIKNNPLAFLKLYVKKIYYFWWFSPQSGYIYPKIYLKIYRCLYAIMLSVSIFGFIGAVRSGRKVTRDGALLLLWVCMAVFLTQSFFYIEGRHRWLIEPLLLVFFAHGLAGVFRMVTGKVRA